MCHAQTAASGLLLQAHRKTHLLPSVGFSLPPAANNTTLSA